MTQYGLALDSHDFLTFSEIFYLSDYSFILWFECKRPQPTT